MESLRDEEVDSLTGSSDVKAIIDSGAESGSRLGDPVVELETPDAWPAHQSRNKKETSDKRVRLFRVIGEQRQYFQKGLYSISISEKKVLPFAVLLLGAIYTAVAAMFYFE